MIRNIIKLVEIIVKINYIHLFISLLANTMLILDYLLQLPTIERLFTRPSTYMFVCLSTCLLTYLLVYRQPVNKQATCLLSQLLTVLLLRFLCYRLPFVSMFKQSSTQATEKVTRRHNNITININNRHTSCLELS